MPRRCDGRPEASLVERGLAPWHPRGHMTDLILGQDWLRPVHHLPERSFGSGGADYLTTVGYLGRQARAIPWATFLSEVGQDSRPVTYSEAHRLVQQRHGIHVASLVPHLLRLLASRSGLRREPPASLRYAVSAAAPLSVAAATDLGRRRDRCAGRPSARKHVDRGWDHRELQPSVGVRGGPEVYRVRRRDSSDSQRQDTAPGDLQAVHRTPRPFLHRRPIAMRRANGDITDRRGRRGDAMDPSGILVDRVLECANRVAGTTISLQPGGDLPLRAFGFDSFDFFDFICLHTRTRESLWPGI